MDEELKLSQYYNDYIKGHSDGERQLGMDFSMAIYDMWKDIPTELKKGISYIFDERLDDYYIEQYRKNHPQFTSEELKGAIDYVNHCSFYSDWYKDVYGIRP